jgi:hypothetical protein
MMFRANKETMFFENDVQNVERKFILHPFGERDFFQRSAEFSVS